MKKTLPFYLTFLILLLYACAPMPATPSESIIQTAIAETVEAHGKQTGLIVKGVNQISTEIPTKTPRPTNTPYPTRTPKPSSTSTPTLFPGQFPFTAVEIRENFYEDLGIHCMEPAQSSLGGYYWDCRGLEDNNALRVIFFGEQENEVSFIHAWAMNVFDPSDSQASRMFSYMTENVFQPVDRRMINQWIMNNLPKLSGSDIEMGQGDVSGYSIYISGAGVCRVLEIGEVPSQGIDPELIPQLSDLEMFCQPNRSP